MTDRHAALAELHGKYADLVELCQDLADCDVHHGIAADPDRITYCFTHHERWPCMGEEIRQALAALEP